MMATNCGWGVNLHVFVSMNDVIVKNYFIIDDIMEVKNNR